jgi:hypothetical protein
MSEFESYARSVTTGLDLPEAMKKSWPILKTRPGAA